MISHRRKDLGCMLLRCALLAGCLQLSGCVQARPYWTGPYRLLVAGDGAIAVFFEDCSGLFGHGTHPRTDTFSGGVPSVIHCTRTEFTNYVERMFRGEGRGHSLGDSKPRWVSISPWKDIGPGMWQVTTETEARSNQMWFALSNTNRNGGVIYLRQSEHPSFEGMQMPYALEDRTNQFVINTRVYILRGR